MRILYITTHLNRGGITSYLTSLAISLKHNGHDVVVASSGGDNQRTFSHNNIEYIKIPIRTKQEISIPVLLSYFTLKRFLLKNHIDVIHAHTRVTQVLAALLARKFNIPFIATCHGFFKPRWHRRTFPCWGDKTIAISSQVKEHLMREFKVEEKNIFLVHNGIDLDKLEDCRPEEAGNLKDEVGINRESLVVGTTARFSTVKGLEFLIKSLPEVLKVRDNVVLLLVGQGREEPELRKLAKGLGIENKVVFFKPTKVTSKYVCAMDIFVMPSIQEGLGISILEAQAQKVPVVASKVGGIPDIIEDRVTGILVEPKNESAIAKAILELSQNKELYSLIKENAHAQLVNKFSLKQMVTKTEKAYIRSIHDFKNS
ncbi:glycosyltransferase family 4 protein [Candidatus Omnitrophota bacterium]